jgi:hypothetical protein
MTPFRVRRRIKELGSFLMFVVLTFFIVAKTTQLRLLFKPQELIEACGG